MASGLYQEQILDHYKHPRNKGKLDDPTLHAGDSNPLCGDSVELFLRVDGEDRIADVRFDGQGCAISQASASLLTTLLQGKTLAEARALGKEELLKDLGVPLSAVRVQCAVLSWNVLRRALGETSSATGS